MFKIILVIDYRDFTAQFKNASDLNQMVAMVANGAQVRECWYITILNEQTGACVTAQGQTTQNMALTVEKLLGALYDMPKRPRAPHQNYDVVVPVHLAIAGDRQLVDAEDFVRHAMEKALQEHGDAVALTAGADTAFMYNGDTVHIDSATEA